MQADSINKTADLVLQLLGSYTNAVEESKGEKQSRKQLSDSFEEGQVAVRKEKVESQGHDLGSKGNRLPLLTNHFKVNVENTDGYFFQYSVALFYEDGRPVEGKGAAQNKLEIKVVLEDVASNTNNGNCSPEGNGSPNEADRNSG
ncbi:hypothetical protein TSUD_129510 [Trifolium subterraneum]|uniref:Uncharacterized protein n=1 Tax=Trifolium subterraneum TaxID=3900 RepID=A0A2Z6NM74_TRISU|nr:hypothetical protein TSUD_129510 [Trifolium subterraneum]